MGNAWIYGRRLVEWLVIFALGHGIILYLATIEIFPDRLVASMITTAVAAPAWAHWIMAALFGLYESVRELHVGLHSFRSMKRMEARRRKASALWLRHSQSLASLRQRPSQARVRSPIQRLGSTTKVLA